MLGNVGHSAWLRQIGPLPLKVLKSVLISHQIVHLCLREHRLLQILLIATHVKPARIKAKLVVIAGHAQGRLQLAPEQSLLVDVRKERVIDYVIKVVCTTTQTRLPIFVQKLEDNVHELIAIIDSVFAFVGENDARLPDLQQE